MSGLDLQTFALNLGLETKAYVGQAIAAAIAPFVTRVKALEDELAILRAQPAVVGPMGPVGPAGPEGSRGADGKDADASQVRSAVVADLQPVMQATIREEVDRHISAWPVPRDGRDGKDVDLVAVKTIVEASVAAEMTVALAKAVAALPTPKDGRDGKDVDIVAVKSLVDAAVAAIPRPKDGRDGKDIDVEQVRAEIASAVAAIPIPKDGRDGKDLDVHKVKAMVLEAVEAVRPEPVDIPALVTREVAKAVDAIPKPKDGHDGIDGKDAPPVAIDLIVESIVAMPDVLDSAVGRYLTAHPPKDGANGKDGEKGDPGVPGTNGIDGKNGSDGLNGKDGAGLTGAFIDRDDHLILTLSDGSTKDCGVVVGKSVDIADVGRFVQAELATWERPKDGAPGLNGKDGFGFDDLSVGFDETNGYFVRFTRGDEVKDFRIAVPWYAGVWQGGRRYPKGAMVTHKKHLWNAKADTFARPATSMEWQLSAQGGRDGKDAPGPRDE